MSCEVLMPRIWAEMKEGKISKWLARVGEPVERDQPLFEVETEKVDAEVPSPATGVFSKALYSEGTTVRVDTVVALIEAVVKEPSIGILAGMGPRSTGPFIDLVVTECQRQYGARDDIDFPKMMICSQPAPFYEDRPTDHAAMETAIRKGLRDLERTGVDFLAIACNTAHIYYPQLAGSVRIPLLNMVELTLDALPRDTRRIALLAARPTVESGIYQAGIRARGFQLSEPDWQSQVDHLLGTTRTPVTPSVLTEQWKMLTERAGAEGVDTLVLACLDLSAAVAHADTDLRIVDAAQCLAQEVVKQWLSRQRQDAG